MREVPRRAWYHVAVNGPILVEVANQDRAICGNVISRSTRHLPHWERVSQPRVVRSPLRPISAVTAKQEGDGVSCYPRLPLPTISGGNMRLPPDYVSQSDSEQAESRLYTFMSRKNIIFSCSFMLEEARTLSEPLIIDPTQNDYGKIIKFDREELFPPLLCDGLARNW